MKSNSEEIELLVKSVRVKESFYRKIIYDWLQEINRCSNTMENFLSLFTRIKFIFLVHFKIKFKIKLN